MATPYCGHVTIGNFDADIDITNVDVLRWSGTATNVRGTGPMPADAVVTLLEQPRPGWSASAQAIAGADGVLRLTGTGHFYRPTHPVGASEGRSLWVRKLPRAT
jgi:hypothetical protein